MHGQPHIEFIDAKQAKAYTNSRTSKDNYTKPQQQYGITKIAGNNN